MKKVIACSLIAMMTAFTGAAFADKVCLKIVSGKKIKTTVSTVPSTAVCPKGTTQIIDTATLTGPSGVPGVPGSPGAQGPAGGFLPTLPSGQLLTGVYGGFNTATAANQSFTDSQTFAFKLATPIATANAHFLKDGDPAIPQCPGTATAPDAQAGHLCVFESTQGNRSAPIIFNSETGGLGSHTRGFSIFTVSVAGGGNTITYGSYAVRAQ